MAVRLGGGHLLSAHWGSPVRSALETRGRSKAGLSPSGLSSRPSKIPIAIGRRGTEHQAHHPGSWGRLPGGSHAPRVLKVDVVTAGVMVLQG
jgi:hypothetical protein